MHSPIPKNAALLLRIALGASAGLANVPAFGQQMIEGVAYAKHGGAVVYRETHWLYRDAGGDARLVLYRCPDGRAFGRKTLRDGRDPAAPDFEFVDARHGYREGLRTRGGSREVFHQDGARKPLRGGRVSVRGLVADAGFDAYVRTHWDAIAARDGRVVPFLIPSRLAPLDFRIGEARDLRESGRAVRRLRMRIDGLLGRALPDVELTYDVATRRLLRFTGPGTVRDARGRVQSIRVEFPREPVTSGVTRAQIDAAARTPLAPIC